MCSSDLIAATYGSGQQSGLSDYFLSLAGYDAHFTDHLDAQVWVKAAPGADRAALHRNLERVIRDYPTAQVQDQAQFKASQGSQIDQILKEAKATGLSRYFLGYQAGEKEVFEQVNAIWTALQRRGITYSSITNTTPNQGVYAQHVRFLDESISMTQANCVDGSVLMASVLKKIKIKASLVVVPGHCYLAFYSQDPAKGGKLYAVETTMLGAKSSLLDAINTATAQAAYSLQKNAAKFDQEDSGYMLVDLDAAREMGIMPIPYVKGLK